MFNQYTEAQACLMTSLQEISPPSNWSLKYHALILRYWVTKITGHLTVTESMALKYSLKDCLFLYYLFITEMFEKLSGIYLKKKKEKKSNNYKWIPQGFICLLQRVHMSVNSLKINQEIIIICSLDSFSFKATLCKKRCTTALISLHYHLCV